MIIIKIFPYFFLQKVYEHIKLVEKYHSHFALFIIIQDELSGNIKSEYICFYNILLIHLYMYIFTFY